MAVLYCIFLAYRPRSLKGNPYQEFWSHDRFYWDWDAGNNLGYHIMCRRRTPLGTVFFPSACHSMLCVICFPMGGVRVGYLSGNHHASAWDQQWRDLGVHKHIYRKPWHYIGLRFGSVAMDSLFFPGVPQGLRVCFFPVQDWDRKSVV